MLPDHPRPLALLPGSFNPPTVAHLAIAEAARVLTPGGTLLVVDFAAHEREELRDRDAHIRLGFEDEVMAGWFASAGLEIDHVQHLEGGELTVTLWRGVKAALPQRRAA